MNAAIASTLCALLAAADPNAGIIRIDFGTADSPVRPGWLRVTDRTVWGKDAPAGWVEPNGLWSRDWPVSREWTMNESRGSKSPPPIYTTDLRQDHVGGSGPATLRLRAPEGKCRVWLLAGTGGGNDAQVWNIRASTGGDGAEATFSGRYAARVLELAAEARGGSLDLAISTRSRWTLSAMLVVPEDRWPDMRADQIAKIEQEAFLLPDDVLKDWRNRPHEEQAAAPEPTEAEKRRGFLVYHRSYLDPIWPNTAPRREECEPTLRAFASQDEYEPLTFTILPLRNLNGLAVQVSDLKAADGQTISREEIVVRYVRYMHVRPNYSTFGTYYRAPDVLMPFRTAEPLVKGESFRVWLTVHVGASAAPGVYRGVATVLESSAARRGQVLAEVPIVFRVLPIKLQKDQSIVYGTYYYHPYDSAVRAPDEFSRRWWQHKAEAEFADMAVHGLNAWVGGIGGRMDKDALWTMDFDALGKKIDLARRFGFDKPIICHIPTEAAYRKYVQGSMGSHLRLVQMPPQGFFDDMTAMVREIEAGRKQRQWPELLYYPVDEPSTSEVSVRFMVEVLKAIKRVPGVRTYVTADPAHEGFAPMRPFVDVWCCQPFSLPRETILADMKARGVEYWCYPNHVAGENDHTPAAGARMTYGFGFWRSGFRALTPWIYQSVTGDPWNYLDGSSMDFFNRTDDDGGPIPVALWEAYREGIDDARYVTTLERWIERARAAGLAKEADEAAAELKYVWDSVDVQEKYKHDGLWEPETFDVYRWVLARQVLKLQQALAPGR